MQIEIFRTKGKTVPKNGMPTWICQTLEELEEEINDFIWKVKVVDMKHTIDSSDSTFHFFTVMYEEED